MQIDKKLPIWMEGLKKMNVDIRELSFKDLKVFQNIEKYLDENIEGSEEFKYLMQSFRYLFAHSLLLIFEKKITSLTKCWNDLEKLFLRQDMFEDGVFVESWIFCDFPIEKKKKQTALDLFDDFMKKTSIYEDIKYFVQQMRKSRIGIYQEILSSKEVIKFKELITGRIVEAQNTVVEFEKGELFLIRLVEIGDKNIILGDPKCWPREHKKTIENMILDKLFEFEGDISDEHYNLFMKKAGIYWMSCVSSDHSIPILSPEHYKEYYS